MRVLGKVALHEAPNERRGVRPTG